MIEPGGTRPTRVLVVEDEALIAMDLEQWLTEFGCEVVGPFKRQEDALRALAQHDVDFAVLDYILGDENSSRVAERLDQLGVPFVFMTGCHELLRAPRPEAPMLEKPISRLQMTKALEEVWTPGVQAGPATAPSPHAERHCG